MRSSPGEKSACAVGWFALEEGGGGRGGEGLNAHLVDFDNMKVDGTALQRKGTGTPKIAQLQKIAFVNHKN